MLCRFQLLGYSKSFTTLPLNCFSHCIFYISQHCSREQITFLRAKSLKIHILAIDQVLQDKIAIDDMPYCRQGALWKGVLVIHRIAANIGGSHIVLPLSACVVTIPNGTSSSY